MSPTLNINKKMANSNIVSARVSNNVYSALKAILDNQNLTISEFLKSAVDGVSTKQIEAVYTNINKKTDKGFLAILAITTLAIVGVYQIVQMKQLNSIKINGHNRQ